MNGGTTRNEVERLHRALSGLLAGALVVLAAPGALAATASETCEARKNDTAAKYASCLHKAQANFVAGGSVDSPRLLSRIWKCGERYTKFWMSAEEEAAGMCPVTGDAAGIQGFLDACIFSAEDTIGGAALPMDVTTCNTAVAICDADLATCLNDCVATLTAPLRTGQTTSYGTGSDGDSENGAVRNFIDNGDGTITDNVTGLMWEKKSDDGSIHDKDDRYSWSMAGVPFADMNGTIVTTFLATLNAGSGFAGHTDWRIPNLHELESLRNLETFRPAVYPAFDHACMAGCTVTNCSCTSIFEYWSSTTYRLFQDAAWIVGFGSGGTDASLKADDFVHVRAVRAGS